MWPASSIPTKLAAVGHLFVAQGDLTRLACDALLIPCDSSLNVNSVWDSILPEDLPVGDMGDWLQLEGEVNAEGVVALPANDNRLVTAFVAVDIYVEPNEVVDRLWKALAYVSDACLPPIIG